MHENNSAEVTSTSKLHIMNENAHQFCISNFFNRKKKHFLCFYWIIACIRIVWFWMRQITVECFAIAYCVAYHDWESVECDIADVSSAQWKRLHANKIVIYLLLSCAERTKFVWRKSNSKLHPLKIWWRCAFL